MSLFEDILTDRTSGSLELARRSLAAVRVALHQGAVDDARQFLLFLRQAFPSMAAILNLSKSLLEDLSIHNLHRLELLLADRTWLERIVHIFPAEPARVLTLSHSVMVFDLLTAHADRLESVACCRSMPGGEGETICRRLAAAGVQAHLLEDADAQTALSSAHFVLVGADMVCDEYIVNKVGTYALADLCRKQGKPCYVAAGALKQLADDVATHFVVTPPFERVPREWVRLIV